MLIMDIFYLFGFHCLADYAFQSEFLSKYKSRNSFVLVCHCMIYALVMTLGFEYVGNNQFPVDKPVIFMVILITHFIIDAIKCIYRQGIEPESEADVRGYYLDQAAHVVVNIGLLFWSLH